MKILIYRLGSLGDTIVALPALHVIARAFPGATRTMLTNFSISTRAAPIAEILENTGLIHDYIDYRLNLRNPFELLALARRIRALRADALVYLTAPRGRLKVLRDAVFFRACGIRTQIGVPYTLDLQKKRSLGAGRHEYEGARLLRCIESLGAQNLAAPAAFDLRLTEAEHAGAERLLADLDGVPILAVSIGAKVDVKDWGDAPWRALIPRLAASLPGWGLVMLGAAVERGRSESLARLWRGPALNLCGVVSVRGSAAILARARLYLGHDSGPMHLAAAVGTPCVAIFSSQNLPGQWFPPGERHKILYHEIDCQGCGLEVCVERDKACIRSITVGEVAGAVAALAAELDGTEEPSPEAAPAGATSGAAARLR